MKRLPTVAVFTAVLLGSFWLLHVSLTSYRAARLASPGLLENAVLDPFDTPLLRPYKAYRDAIIGNDFETLEALAGGDGFLAYRATLDLARSTELSPRARLVHYQKAERLRVDDPLARQENREFYLEMGRVAEAAGAREEAVRAYGETLPEERAVAALARLEENRYRLANLYFQNRLYQEALDTLGELSAPSIEAPAHQRLEQHELALDAFERWLDEQPDSLEARYGQAWSHFYLGNLDTAYALFEALPGENSYYGRALIDRQRGSLDRAVDLLMRSGTASRMWQATSWLEAEGDYREALPLYLRLAQGSSVYADDAAYRAAALAKRLGEDELAEQAAGLLPSDSFFSIRQGALPPLPDSRALPEPDLQVIDLAWQLARVSDLEAAKGELIFALRDAQDEATVVTIAEALQLLGEYRQSQRAAQRFVNAGSREVRTWRAAYPRAFPELVEAEAARNDLEPELVWAVMRQESAFYPRAVSVANAAGLMQVIPSTWDWIAELQDEQPGDPFDPRDNIRYGTYYLRWLMDYHDGDAELVIPSYNRGQGYIRRLFESESVSGDKDLFFRRIDALETREYLQRVTLNYHVYRALYGDGALAETADPAGENAR